MGLAEVQHLLEDGRPAWQHQARCAELKLPADLFFPGHGYDEKAAKAACRGCPVRGACLAHALEARELTGVWGGANAAERRRLTKRARAAGQQR